MAAQAHSAMAVDRKDLSGPALRTFFRIAELWSLSTGEQMILLGMAARSTFFKWKKDPNVVLPKDTLERISYIVGIATSGMVGKSRPSMRSGNSTGTNRADIPPHLTGWQDDARDAEYRAFPIFRISPGDIGADMTEFVGKCVRLRLTQRGGVLIPPGASRDIAHR